MNLKVLESIYREDYLGLFQIFATKAASPDIQINEVRLIYVDSF